MKRFAVAAVLTVAVAVLAFADDLADYQPLMKSGAGAVSAMGKALDDGDGAAAQESALEVAEHFGAISDWWAEKGAEDAQGFASDVAEKAMEIHEMAGAGDMDSAKAQLDALRGNCKSCHVAHRVKADDGSWQIK